MNKREHLLVCLQEELAEVQHAIGKALRFGLDDVHNGLTNLQYIENELADANTIVSMLEEEGIPINQMSDEEFDNHCEEKEAKVEHYMKYAKERGCLDE